MTKAKEKPLDQDQPVSPVNPPKTGPSESEPAVSMAASESPGGNSEQAEESSSQSSTTREAAVEKARAALVAAKQAAGKSSAFAREHLDPARHDGLFVVRYLDRLVERIRVSMASAPADRCVERLVHYGNLAAVVAMALALLYGVLGSVRHALFSPIPKAVAFVLLLAAFQYAANKFLSAGRSLMASTPSRLGSSAFLNTVALLHTVMAVVFLIGGLLLALQQRDLGILILGAFLAFVAYGIAFISLYPDRINITVDPAGGAGEEALGILSYGLKVLLHLLPIIYGLGMIAGMLAMLGASFARLGRTGITPLGQQGGALLLFAAAAPFTGYLLFAFLQLGLDVLRSILVLPAKLGSRIENP